MFLYKNCNLEQRLFSDLGPHLEIAPIYITAQEDGLASPGSRLPVGRPDVLIETAPLESTKVEIFAFCLQ